MRYPSRNAGLPALMGLGLLAAPATAQTFYSNGATVVVHAGGTLYVNGGAQQAGGATLRTAGTVTVAGSLSSAAASTLDLDAGQLSVAGDVAQQGATTGSTGTLRLTGAAAQIMALAGGTVPNLTVDKTAGTATLAGPIQVRRVLSLAGAGNLDANGQTLTLLSDASGTALLANLGTGRVLGSLTVQRYLDGTLNAGLGYRHLAAPVTGPTVAAFASGGTAQVVNSDYNTSATPTLVTPFPTVFRYDQARLATSPATNLSTFDKGWVSPASPGESLPPGNQGFTVQLPGASTLSFVGAAVQTSGAIAMSRASGATAAEAGWNFVGNPYAAPLDLSTVTSAQRQNLDAAVYVFESSSQYGGNYRSYVNGVGGGNPLIGSSQGFWMRVSPGQTSGTLALTNTNRVTDYAQQAPVRRPTADPRPLVQLALAGPTGPADALYFYAEAGATPARDGEYDAVKLPNSTGLNLSSAASSGEALAIDGRPAFTAATVLPLSVGVPAADTYTLTAAQLLNLPAGLTAYLRDAQTGTLTPLAAGRSYGFQVSAAQATALVQGRFSVAFTAAPLATTSSALAAQVSLYPNPAHAQPVTVVLPGVAGASAVQAELRNALGQVVLRQQAALPAGGAQLTLPTADLAAGVYVLHLTVGNAIVTRRLTVH